VPPILPSCSKTRSVQPIASWRSGSSFFFVVSLAPVRRHPAPRRSQSEPQNSLITRSPDRTGSYICIAQGRGSARIASLRRWQLMKCGRAISACICSGSRGGLIASAHARSKDEVGAIVAPERASVLPPLGANYLWLRIVHGVLEGGGCSEEHSARRRSREIDDRGSRTILEPLGRSD